MAAPMAWRWRVRYLICVRSTGDVQQKFVDTHPSCKTSSLHRRRYAPSSVRRVIHIMFLPSLRADRGPVALAPAATVGNGRGGTSLTILRSRFTAFFGSLGFCTLGAGVVAPLVEATGFFSETGSVRARFPGSSPASRSVRARFFPFVLLFEPEVSAIWNESTAGYKRGTARESRVGSSEAKGCTCD